jgi:hypothetical protein
MSEPGYKLTEAAVRRIASAVREIEGFPSGEPARPQGWRPSRFRKRWYKIVTNETGGKYTVKLQGHDLTSARYALIDEPDAHNIEFGLTQDAWDFAGRDHLQAGRLVAGWKVRLNDTWRLFIDAATSVTRVPCVLYTGWIASSPSLATLDFDALKWSVNSLDASFGPSRWISNVPAFWPRTEFSGAGDVIWVDFSAGAGAGVSYCFPPVCSVVVTAETADGGVTVGAKFIYQGAAAGNAFPVYIHLMGPDGKPVGIGNRLAVAWIALNGINDGSPAWFAIAP